VKTNSRGLVAVQGDGDVAVVGLEQDAGGRALGDGGAGSSGGRSRSAADGLGWRRRVGGGGCVVSLGGCVRRGRGCRRRRRVVLVVLEDLLELVHCAWACWVSGSVGFRGSVGGMEHDEKGLGSVDVMRASAAKKTRYVIVAVKSIQAA